ncbi:MAG: AAA family ATPase [Actinobacteria bacterium]|nr:AAA family ATPase [Actinomycetota bacterium]
MNPPQQRPEPADESPDEMTAVVDRGDWQGPRNQAPAHPYEQGRPYQQRPQPPSHHQQPAQYAEPEQGRSYPPPPAAVSLPATRVPARRDVRDDSKHVALDKTDVRRMSVPAEHGWRAALNKILPGITIGPGKDERYEISLKERVIRPVRTTFTVAVLNLKGGVGKTTATKALGSVMCDVRGDKVIAVDLDNDSGNLTERHGRETHLSIIELVSDPSVSRYHDVRAHTSSDKVSKLEVLAQPDFARSERIVEREDFESAMELLQEYYSVVLLDCGTALKSELMKSVLHESRAVVVVTNASIDALEETDRTLDWLRHTGYLKLLENLVLIINHTETGKPNVVVDKVVEQFTRKIPQERIFVTPFDRHVHEGREINLKLLSKKSRRRYLEIAAAVSDLFPKTAS